MSDAVSDAALSSDEEIIINEWCTLDLEEDEDYPRVQRVENGSF